MSDENLTSSGSGDSKSIPKEKENQATDQADAKPQSSETPSPVSLSKPNEPPTPRHQCKKRYKCVKEEVKFWFEVGGIIGGLFGLYLIWLQ
ncbi:MAG: hypothetical protein WBN22_06715 [Verrucomicrobiia bacterium]